MAEIEKPDIEMMMVPPHEQDEYEPVFLLVEDNFLLKNRNCQYI